MILYMILIKLPRHLLKKNASFSIGSFTEFHMLCLPSKLNNYKIIDILSPKRSKTDNVMHDAK